MVRGRWLSLSVSVAVLVASFAVPARAADETLLYIFAGQSNMVGAFTKTAELSAVAPNLMRPPSNVQFFGPTGERATRWGPLGPTTETAPQAIYGHGFGPELAAGHRLSRLHSRENVAIVKFARNNTNLHTDWNPDRRGSLYHQMLARTSAARKALKRPTRIAGFFWMQGEADSDSAAHAYAYGRNLTRLISRLRADLRTPRLSFVLGRVGNLKRHNAKLRYSDVVRAQQRVVATLDPYTFLVSTDKLELDRVSPVHYSTRGTVGLGSYFAQSRFGL